MHRVRTEMKQKSRKEKNQLQTRQLANVQRIHNFFIIKTA